jgi:hypothetical protein
MITKIGDRFSLENVFDINLLNGVEEVIHEYGTEFNIPADKLLWMNYSRPEGTIGFTRNTSKFYPELTKYVVKYLESLIDLKFYPERVHFIRTRGSIVPHRDEAGRKCCINIGIHNSNSAITQYSDIDAEETFMQDYKECVCEDGSAYLLDTSKLHAVIGDSRDRLLITYGFGATYDQILGKLR